MKSRSLIFVLIFSAFLSSHAQSPSEQNKRLDQTLAQLRANLSIPGMAVAVSQNAQLLYSQAFGYADLKNQIPATDTTLFRLASVSKLLTNLAIVKLHQDERLNVADPVENYLPDYPHAGQGVTIERLCRHLGGIRHYQGGDFTNSFKHYDNTQESLEIFIDDPLVHKPGSQYKYSSFAYTLLQAVIEAASGKEFLTYLSEDIFAPLGMNRTFADQVDRTYADRSLLYRVTPKGKARKTAHDDPSYKWGGGGMLSSVCDLISFGEAHLAGDFLTDESRNLMFTPAVKMPGFDEATSIGLTWRIGQDNHGQRIFHHAGSMNGARSFLLLCPEENLVIAILSNANELDWIHHLAFSIKDALLRPEPTTAKPFASNTFQILQQDAETNLGSISFGGAYPIYQAELKMPGQFDESMLLNLCASQHQDSLQLKNVKVEDAILYFQIDWVEGSEANSIQLVYRNEDDEIVDQTYLLRLE